MKIVVDDKHLQGMIRASFRGLPRTESIMGMLCLTRSVGQRIAIGEDITVTVLDISGGRVTLGVDAPRSVPVHRMQVRQAIARIARLAGLPARSPAPAPARPCELGLDELGLDDSTGLSLEAR